MTMTARPPTRRASPARVAAPVEERRRPTRRPMAWAANPAAVLEAVTGTFVVLALVLMLSSSSVISIAQYGSGLALFERQLVWTMIGGIGFWWARRVRLERLRQVAPVFLIAILASLALVLAIGRSVGGSSRWIGVGFLRFQPTEFAKLAFALFAADFVARRANTRSVFSGLVLPLGAVFAALALLVVMQPDLGSTIVLSLVFIVLLFGAGIERRIFVRVALSVFTVGAAFALSAPYRRERLLSFTAPFSHASTSGYQLVQSLLALGSGHLTGTGFGSSSATWGFLPNAQTDFIFAVIGNQYGFVGALVVIIGYAIIGVCGIRIAMAARDRYSAMLALAITTWIVGQAIINIGGVISVLPETGIPLPFLSFGGSSLIAVMTATGLLVNVAGRTSRRANGRTPARDARRRAGAGVANR